MANFEKAYEKTAKYEGGYSNIINDTGGETYAGISRKWFPENEIWKYIDKERLKGEIPNNQKFSYLDSIVKDFYQVNFWNKIQGDKIKSQEITEQIFDFAVNAGTKTSIMVLQRLLNIGLINVDKKQLKVDGFSGLKTIKILNEIDKLWLLNILQLERVKFYTNLAKNRTQRKFLYSWIKRIIN